LAIGADDRGVPALLAPPPVPLHVHAAALAAELELAARLAPGVDGPADLVRLIAARLDPAAPVPTEAEAAFYRFELCECAEIAFGRLSGRLEAEAESLRSRLEALHAQVALA
jgi:hypothetical protein